MAMTCLLATSATAVAGPTCTDEPQGKCWEIHGHDEASEAVEVYFHPITGVVVEARFKD